MKLGGRTLRQKLKLVLALTPENLTKSPQVLHMVIAQSPQPIYSPSPVFDPCVSILSTLLTPTMDRLGLHLICFQVGIAPGLVLPHAVWMRTPTTIPTHHLSTHSEGLSF